MNTFEKSTGIFTHSHKQKLDTGLANAIGRWCYVTGFENVADLGCSYGRYCLHLKNEYNLNCVGYEGNQKAIANRVFYDVRHIDLSNGNANPHGHTYDLVVCLEVGEHIPKEKCEIFVDNVLSFTKKDLLLSWATPERKGGGIGHVNELTNKEVIEIFSKKGFQYHNDLTEIFRNSSKVRWFKTNIMYFRSKS